MFAAHQTAQPLVVTMIFWLIVHYIAIHDVFYQSQAGVNGGPTVREVLFELPHGHWISFGALGWRPSIVWA